MQITVQRSRATLGQTLGQTLELGWLRAPAVPWGPVPINRGAQQRAARLLAAWLSLRGSPEGEGGSSVRGTTA